MFYWRPVVAFSPKWRNEQLTFTSWQYTFFAGAKGCFVHSSEADGRDKVSVFDALGMRTGWKPGGHIEAGRKGSALTYSLPMASFYIYSQSVVTKHAGWFDFVWPSSLKLQLNCESHSFKKVKKPRITRNWPRNEPDLTSFVVFCEKDQDDCAVAPRWLNSSSQTVCRQLLRAACFMVTLLFCAWGWLGKIELIWTPLPPSQDVPCWTSSTFCRLPDPEALNPTPNRCCFRSLNVEPAASPWNS